MQHDNEYYIRKIVDYFESLDLKVEIEPESEYNPIGIIVSDDENMSLDWQSGKITSLYFYFYPIFNAKINDYKYLLYINSIGIKKEDRGNGIASKLIGGLIEIFGSDLGLIGLDDLNKSGIWQHLAKKFSQVRWDIN